MKLTKLFAAAAVAAVAMGSQAAWATDASGTLSVSATVAATCSVNSPALAFGAYAPLSAAAKDGTATVTVTCTNGTAWTLKTTDDTAARVMASVTTPADTLAFEVYTDSSHSAIFDTAGNGGADAITGSGTGEGQDNTLYGRIAASQISTKVHDDYQMAMNLTVSY